MACYVFGFFCYIIHTVDNVIHTFNGHTDIYYLDVVFTTESLNLSMNEKNGDIADTLATDFMASIKAVYCRL